ncbi:MAG: T9SS type A sorting domain-containing protein [Flavobacteriaceae bacterium]
MTLSNIDASPYAQIEIDFYFYVYSMENNEDFWVRFYDGSSWTTVATYVRGSGIENNTFYQGTVVLDAAQYNFASNSGFRFQCDASGNNDHIYIDQVTITGITSGAPAANSLVALGRNIGQTEGSSNFNDDLIIYPNPVKNIVNVNPSYNVNANYRIVDLTGKTIMSGSMLNNTIDVSKLKTGVYLLELSDEEEKFVQKFIKQ